MKKHFALIIGVASLLGGCLAEPPPPPPQAAQPTTSPVPSPEQISEAPKISDALAVPGLIPPTNPNQQRTEVIVGRADPFALIPVKPIVTINKTAVAQDNTNGDGSSTPGDKTSGKPRDKSGTSKNASNSNTGTSPGQNPNLFPPHPPSLPALPPLPPEPTEADQVTVSGIIQLPTTAIAIVQAPGERTVRSVAPGATLSNGQVLVKVIDANPENPIVILEQYGIQVTKKLGDGVKPPEPAAPS